MEKNRPVVDPQHSSHSIFSITPVSMFFNFRHFSSLQHFRHFFISGTVPTALPCLECIRASAL